MIQVEFKENQNSADVYGLTQWDYGQILVITGIPYQERMEIHFALQGEKEALVQEADKEEESIVARIPDVLLRDGRDIKAYLYFEDAEKGITVRTVYLPVKSREKPEDYITEEHKDVIQKIIERLGLKADDLSLDENVLQLLSGDHPIGKRVRLPTAREIELRNHEDAIQWRYTDSNEWTDLVQLESLRGKDGQTPAFELRNGHLYAIYQEEK